MEKMGSNYRKEDSFVIADIAQNSSEYEFYQLAHLLESVNHGNTSVAEGIEPSDETVRFSGNFNLGFSSGDVQKVSAGDDGENPFQILINFFGMGGALGPLPVSYTHFVLERYWQKDKAINSFLDNFNHRLISLIYRVLKTHKPMADGTSVDTERFALNILSILGFGNNFLKNRMSVPDRAILNFSGIFSRGTYSSGGLESVLSVYFKFPVAVRPLHGGWGWIPERQWTYIGIESGENNILGRSFLLGTRAWLQQSAFNMEVGPLSFMEYLDILPMGKAFKPICDFVKYYVGQESDFYIKAVLKADEVPIIRLGGHTGREGQLNVIGDPRLSWSFILRSSEEESAEEESAEEESAEEESAEETMVILSDKIDSDNYFDYLVDPDNYFDYLGKNNG